MIAKRMQQKTSTFDDGETVPIQESIIGFLVRVNSMREFIEKGVLNGAPRTRHWALDRIKIWQEAIEFERSKFRRWYFECAVIFVETVLPPYVIAWIMEWIVPEEAVRHRAAIDVLERLFRRYRKVKNREDD